MFHVKQTYIKYLLIGFLLSSVLPIYARKKSKVNPNTGTELFSDNKIKEEQNLSITLYFFDENGKKLEDWQKCILKETAEELNELGQENYYIIGHTSDSTAVNGKYKLTKRRAIWLSQMLKNYNANADFTTIGRGSREPVIEDEKEAWQQSLNNGVEISTSK